MSKVDQKSFFLGLFISRNGVFMYFSCIRHGSKWIRHVNIWILH
jgi:hypothetical protein